MMPRLRAVGAAVIAVLSVTMALAAPSMADESKSVQVVGQDGREVQFLVYLDPTVVAGADSDVSSTVVVSGVEVPSTATPIVNLTSPEEAILVLDVSGSMRGPRLAAAKEAAVNYVNGLPADVEIGLVSFNDSVTLDVRPTTDKKAVIAAIGELKAGNKTALYDGIVAGLDVANPEKGARLLVLSDGGDTVSAATIDDISARAGVEGIPIDIVALTPTASHADVLRGISTSSGGQFLLATDVAGLNQAFEEATGSFGGKVAVAATMPEDVDASGKFAVVTVGVDGTDFTGTTQLPDSEELASTTATAPTSVPSAGGAPVGTVGSAGDTSRTGSTAAAWIYAVLVALIVITGALAYASYRRQQRSRLRTEQVLWYSSAVTVGNPTTRRPEMKQAGIFESLDEWMSTKSWYPRIDNKVDNAGLTLSVATWLAVRVMAALVLALLVSLLLGNVLIGLVAGGLVGWFVSGAWLNSREAASRKAFEEELPDFLLLIASSLRSGLSFQQGLDSTAAEGQGEVSRQMRRAISEVQMGATIEQALMRVSERMQSEDLKWTVTALTIQREVGGNLSNILESAANTVKARAELRREVRTLSAEGRLSGWVLAALPVGLFVYMLFANRPYISFFWTNTAGWIALGALGIMFILGFIWMRRLIRIEV
jgi:tight adherence protein B